MDAWVGIIGTLAGVLAGGVLTHWTARAQANREMRWQLVRLQQEKLEELAQVLDEIEQHYVELSGEALMKIETGKPIKFSGKRIPKARLTALIEFHAPELMEEKKRLDQLFEEYGKVLAEAIRTIDRSKPERQAMNANLLRGEHKIAEVCKTMTAKAAMLAHRRIGEVTTNPSLQRTPQARSVLGTLRGLWPVRRR